MAGGQDKSATPASQGVTSQNEPCHSCSDDSHAISERDRYESKVGSQEQPAMDRFKVRSARTVSGPRTQDELTLRRSISPEPRSAVTTAAPQ